MTAKTPAPVVLTGRHVRLEPLAPDHVPDLAEAALGEPDIWRYVPVHPPRSEDDLRVIVQQVLDNPVIRLPFAVVHQGTGRAIGCTTYLDVHEEDERLEIGWTWYGRAHWRTGVNTESKLLLLTHAFDDLGYGRVQWKANAENERSRAAILRLGARFEGVHRRDRVLPDGTFRDTAYYAMLRDEWPAARARLAAAAR